jgi:hypothetical protein
MLLLDPVPTERTIIRCETLASAIPDERKLELAQVLDVHVGELMGWDA